MFLSLPDERLIEMLAPPLAAEGFLRTDGPISWEVCFARNAGQVIQQVSVGHSFQSEEAQILTLHFRTSVDQRGIDARDLTDGDVPAMWEHDGVQSLTQIVPEMLRFIVELGIPWLNEHGGSPYIEPGEEHQSALLAAPAELALKLASRWGLDLQSPTALADLEAYLLHQRKTAQPTDWELQIEAAAFLGEWVRRQLNNEVAWGWAEHSSLRWAALLRPDQTDTMIWPLIWVAWFWSKPDRRHRLTGCYQHAHHGWQTSKVYDQVMAEVVGPIQSEQMGVAVTNALYHIRLWLRLPDGSVNEVENSIGGAARTVEALFVGERERLRQRTNPGYEYAYWRHEIWSAPSEEQIQQLQQWVSRFRRHPLVAAADLIDL